MPRLWLVTLLTISTASLLLSQSVDASPILGSTLNITDKNATTIAESPENATLTPAVEHRDVQNNPRFIAKALDVDDWLNDRKSKPSPIDTPVIATLAIDNTTTRTNATTIVASTVVSTIATTTTLDIQVVADDTTEAIVVEVPEIVFNDQESAPSDTQIEAGGSDNKDAPKILQVDVTPDPSPVELIKPGNPATDDEDYAEASSAVTDHPIPSNTDHESETDEDAHLDDDEPDHDTHVVYESSASTPSSKSGNLTIPNSSEDPDDKDDIAPVEIPYILKSDSENTDDFVDKPANGNEYPKTLYDQTNAFMHEFARNYPGVSYVLLCTLLAIIVMLTFLVIRECCKSRHRKRSRVPPSVTADLYNTSACSHFYEKASILPNQEATMQLVSSDISEDMV